MKKGVYIIRNTFNGKCYVGSSRNIAQRWRQHRHTLKAGTSGCRRLQAAWRKYGPDAFSFEILELVDDDELRGAREQYWIDGLGTFGGGYNSSPTVQVSDYMPRPAEWGRAISAAKRGKKIKSNGRLGTSQSSKTCAAKSAALRKHYETNPSKNKGRTLSLEHREKIAAGVRKTKADPKFRTISEEHRASLSKAQRRAWAEGKYAGRDYKHKRSSSHRQRSSATMQKLWQSGKFSETDFSELARKGWEKRRAKVAKAKA